jgi:hypothetical protein
LDYTEGADNYDGYDFGDDETLDNFYKIEGYFEDLFIVEDKYLIGCVKVKAGDTIKINISIVEETDNMLSVQIN